MKFQWWYFIVGAVLAGLFFRVIYLNSLPLSVYWDEVSLGYDAYAISQTGRDHHDNEWPFPAFFSYGDYKPAGYFYLLVPFVKVLGLEAWVVRLPSALAGTSMIIAISWLSYYFLKTSSLDNLEHDQARLAAQLAAWITALSPWAIQFSRGGWEVNVATALVTWGIVCWLSVSKSKSWMMKVVAIALLAAAAYTYHAARVVSPILLGVLFINDFPIHKKKLWGEWFLQSMIWFISLAFLLIPLLIQLKEPAVQKRFAETSLLADGKAVLLSNEWKELAHNSWWAKAIYHRWVVSSWLVMENASLHFSPQFLFLSGDSNLRHGTTATGIFYLTDVVWIICGFLGLSKLRKKRALVLCAWIMAGVLPPAITTAAPHALRFLLAMPAMICLLTIGVLQLFTVFQHKYRTVLIGVFVLLLLANFTYFWRYYTKIYAVQSAQNWQYGYQQLVPVIARYRKEYPEQNIYFTREQGRPAMYYWFYTKTDPRVVQAVKNAPQDQGEFLEFDHIFFINSVNEAKDGLVVSSVKGYEQLHKENAIITDVQTVNDALQKPLWKVYQLQR